MKKFRPLLVLLLMFAFFLPAPASALWRVKKSKYDRGEKVEFSGIVTDADGRPLPDVQVILEASRKEFRLRRMRKEPVDTFRVTVDTGSRGEYSLIWPWNDYYNTYEILIAVPLRRKGQKALEIIARVDITDRAEQTNPLMTPIRVNNATFLYSLRTFLATVDSPDEKRIYETMGRPDKVEQVGTLGEIEAHWWYFDTGKLVHFKLGKLVETKDFDPVKKF